MGLNLCGTQERKAATSKALLGKVSPEEARLARYADIRRIFEA